MESKKSQHVWVWLALELVSIVIIIFFNNIYWDGFGVSLLLTCVFFLLSNVYFRKGKFDADSLYICLSYSIPMLLLIFISFYVSNNKELQKYLKDYTGYAINMDLFFFLYFEFVYFRRCLKAIREIRGDELLLKAKYFKSTLKSLLIFAAANIAILSFSKKLGYMSLTYKFSTVFINFMLLFIDIFIYVHSKIDEFNKQEEEKVDEEKKEKLDEQKYEMDKKELQTIKKEIEMMKNKINRKTAKIEYKIIHYKNK
ncbi:hypothetical protein [Lactobacillus apis]|uniref:hypothetical protein n=1 Tax=Lactobacillus apis TaxID=303541 RepID=UPI00242B5CB3|nr:hypothetical protein [Lactobacillus apis]